jgi:hypothetical protein
MKFAQTLILILLCVSLHGLPDAKCTPGAIDPSVTQANIQTTICKPGYATAKRKGYDARKVKKEGMKAYGYTDSPSNYQNDHVISIELGGSVYSPENQWPERLTGKWNAHDKDRVENALRRAVCAGKLSLLQAQEMITHNWEKAQFYILFKNMEKRHKK